jgi:integrase
MRGHVRKRGGTYSIVYEERPDPRTGERRQRERGGYRTRQQAEAALAETVAAVISNGYVEPAKVTLGQFMEDWIVRKAQDDLKATTEASYRQRLRLYVLPRLGQLRVQELDVATIEDALRDIHRAGGRDGQPLSLRNVRYCRFLLGLALDDAQRRGLIRSNPARLARIPTREHPDWRPRSQPQQPWSVAELRQFLEVAVDDRLAALWITYVRTGARRGELLAATWADVDLDDARLAIRRTRVSAHIGGRRTVYDKAKPKTSTSRRTVTLDDDNVAVLRAHRARQAAERLVASTAWAGEDRIFCREDGSGLDPDRSAPSSASCAGRLASDGSASTTPVTMATLMLAAGIRVEVVSKRLGHARISVTYDMYTHRDDEQQREAADTFGRLLADGGGN